MSGQQRLVMGVATGVGVVGLAATSSLFMIANYFVEQLSSPHASIDPAFNTWRLPQFEPEPPLSQQRALIFHTADGKLLCGEFWAQPHPAPTVVICHGYRVSRAFLRPVAALEYKFGYNILLFDFRGHGESDSVITSGGNAEVRDLQAALTVASQQLETLPGRIIIHGFSMGAAIALLTPPRPEVVAIIADSPYARLDQILRRLVQWELTRGSASWSPMLRRLRRAFPALAWATVAVSRIIFRLRFGYALIACPSTSFKRWQALSKKSLQRRHPPILLIHGMKDDAVPISHAYQIAQQAKACGIPLETYLVENAEHCDAYAHDPERYIQVLQQFLAQHLGSDFPTLLLA
jgi:uncharacterized protein